MNLFTPTLSPSAIDSKDIMTLMAIRDTQFDLLLHKPPGASSAFPIVVRRRSPYPSLPPPPSSPADDLVLL